MRRLWTGGVTLSATSFLVVSVSGREYSRKRLGWMKYIACTVLGLVLLAAICWVVLRANMPTAKLTVHAVRPMRTFASRTLSPDPLEPRPVWDVAITNTGRAAARWFPAFRIKDYNGITYSAPGWACEPSTGVLSVGQHTNV